MSVLTDRCTISSHPVFGPSINVITAISKAVLAEVTTLTDHNYVNGTVVRLYITPACGMQQIDQQFSPITVTSDTTFTMTIDSTRFDTFAIPVDPNALVNICCFSVPIGSRNDTILPAEQNIL